MPMGFALDEAIADNEADFGGLLNSHMSSKGTDQFSQALQETDPTERAALAANLDQIETERARERSEDVRTSADFERAVEREHAPVPEAREQELEERANLETLRALGAQRR